jgi:hypothetical protein
MLGNFPEALVDHIDCDGLNNSWANLRSATKVTNSLNIKRPRKNLTGYTGVAALPSGRFSAQRRVRGQGGYLGTFATASEAHEAYLRARSDAVTAITMRFIPDPPGPI